MHTRRIAVRGIIFDGEKMFAVRQKENDGTVSEFWNTPGGGLDPYENLHEGLVREMLEETGVKPEIGNLLYVQQFYPGNDKDKEQLEFFFHIKNHEDYRVIDLSKTTHGEKELGAYGFVDPKTTAIYPEVISEIDLKTHIDNHEPVIVRDYLR